MTTTNDKASLRAEMEALTEGELDERIARLERIEEMLTNDASAQALREALATVAKIREEVERVGERVARLEAEGVPAAS